MVEILKKLIEARLGGMAFKLQNVLNSPEENSVSKLDDLLTDYVVDVQKLKMIDEIINSSNQEPEVDQEPQ
mgnify:CR=1 FL=1|jgi:hypothetical protein